MMSPFVHGTDMMGEISRLIANWIIRKTPYGTQGGSSGSTMGIAGSRRRRGRTMSSKIEERTEPGPTPTRSASPLVSEEKQARGMR